jgi:hypothetical protein
MSALDNKTDIMGQQGDIPASCPPQKDSHFNNKIQFHKET